MVFGVTRANALIALGVFSFLATSAAEQPSAQESLSTIQHLLQSGDGKRAGELAAELVRTHPDSDAVYEALGRVRDEEGRYEDADAAYQHAIKLAPSAAAPHVSLGVSYVRRGLTQQALQQFQDALQKEPKNLAALLNAASLELEARRFVDAEDLYRRATQVVSSE